MKQFKKGHRGFEMKALNGWSRFLSLFLYFAVIHWFFVPQNAQLVGFSQAELVNLCVDIWLQQTKRWCYKEPLLVEVFHLLHLLIYLQFLLLSEKSPFAKANRFPWQPLCMLRSVMYPIITQAHRPGCGCNYLLCLHGNTEKAFIKLAQWVSIYSRGIWRGKLSKQPVWQSRGKT